VLQRSPDQRATDRPATTIARNLRFICPPPHAANRALMIPTSWHQAHATVQNTPKTLTRESFATKDLLLNALKKLSAKIAVFKIRAKK
jgi:hypothetical protein